MSYSKSKSARRVIDGVLLTIAMIMAIKWMMNPQGPFEPTLAFITLLLAAIDYWDRNRQQPSQTAGQPVVLPSPKSELVDLAGIESESTDLPYFRSATPAAFFAERYSAAFPGLRNTEWFRGKAAVERLSILLGRPLTFRDKDDSVVHPVWWFRDGNLQIRSFQVLDKETVLMDEKELKINSIAAIHSSDYKRLFVYVRCDPMPPCGVYQWKPEDIRSFINDFGYAWEEYGVYKGTHNVTRAEYDDRSTKIMGKIVMMGDDLDLRMRYITPYNFVIASHTSPINTPSFDNTLEASLNALLVREDALDQLIDSVNRIH